VILITCSSSFEAEKKYVIDYIFRDRLGLPYDLSFCDEQEGFLLQLHAGRSVILSSDFWDRNIENYLSSASLPSVHFGKNDFVVENDIPILFGVDATSCDEKTLASGIDVFGACFFMLSRMEEAIIPQRDGHGRFTSTASTAYKFGFLNRPIVDEYIEMLWNMLSRMDATLRRKEYESKRFITCDLDFPFDPVRTSFRMTVKKFFVDIIKKRRIVDALSTLFNFIMTKINLEAEDPYRKSIDWIMRVNEDAGNAVAFYFIPSKTSEYDFVFDLESDRMQELLKEIKSRGHEVGIHPGYGSFDDENVFMTSLNAFKAALVRAGLDTGCIGGRMHYLRWNVFATPQIWEAAGLKYDSTLAFADNTGFRCGTCHDFPLFDLRNKRALNVIERPLTTMESTVIAGKNEGLGYGSAAIDRFNDMREVVKRYGGRYCLLWHNSHLLSQQDRDIYCQLIVR
jgi:hypothetical protein